MALDLASCDADVSKLRVGVLVPTVPREALPAKAQHTFLKASVFVAVLPHSKWQHLTMASCFPGIVHFNNSSFIFVNKFKINIGNQNYGSEYDDKHGFDEKGNAGPFLLWSGQHHYNSRQPIHAKLFDGQRSVYLFVRDASARPFSFWGRLCDATLIKEKTAAKPLRARFRIEDYDVIAQAGASECKLDAGKLTARTHAAGGVACGG